MKKLAYIPIQKSKFHAYESDVEDCSEIYDMEGVTQINKICEIVDNEINIDPIIVNGQEFFFRRPCCAQPA